ncbi:MAG: host attachment family protein [Alphaproteobacteria bacterium]|nr:host attachment family protein [Alphaproteobacteria bacterium]
MRLPHNAWVAVADGEKFLLLTNHGEPDQIDLRVIDKEALWNPPDRQQAADKPGRLNDNGPGQKSAVDQTDWHVVEKSRFAHEIGRHLKQWAMDGLYKDLIVIADPHTLGVLRSEYDAAVKDRLRAEIAKDLTHQPIDKIEAACVAH